jgi:hypothetical protein
MTASANCDSGHCGVLGLRSTLVAVRLAERLDVDRETASENATTPLPSCTRIAGWLYAELCPNAGMTPVALLRPPSPG